MTESLIKKKKKSDVFAEGDAGKLSVRKDGRERQREERRIRGTIIKRLKDDVHLLVSIFGGQRFLELLLCVGVNGRAVWCPNIVPLPHP